MISVFCVIAIAYGIFWGIFLLCNQKKKVDTYVEKCHGGSGCIRNVNPICKEERLG